VRRETPLSRKFLSGGPLFYTRGESFRSASAQLEIESVKKNWVWARPEKKKKGSYIAKETEDSEKTAFRTSGSEDDDDKKGLS